MMVVRKRGSMSEDVGCGDERSGEERLTTGEQIGFERELRCCLYALVRQKVVVELQRLA